MKDIKTIVERLIAEQRDNIQSHIARGTDAGREWASEYASSEGKFNLEMFACDNGYIGSTSKIVLKQEMLSMEDVIKAITANDHLTLRETKDWLDENYRDSQTHLVNATAAPFAWGSVVGAMSVIENIRKHHDHHRNVMIDVA